MKKVFTFSIIILLSYYTFAQIVSYDIIDVKTYNDNKRTSYLQVDSNIDKYLGDFLKHEIVNYSSITHFNFLDNDYNQIVFSSSIDVDEQNFIDILNDIISQFDYDNIVIDFPQTHYLEDYKIVKFYIENRNNSDIESLIDEFSLYDEIISISINDAGNCKLVLEKSVHKNWIEQRFSERDIDIVTLENLNR